ncbi:urease accessory protein UreF [Salipiger aestuarii]|uniref:Urease accessory protein UreF n=1 Tax=Salipiger aestuarii TaxID=568098 RepID=A0A327XW03_9RHOB|nr:urease accessory UreF family protein [Salipiger aestuarii]KAA8607865.1 urease accessory protein UreF [Salipiger aestuarii]KAB2538680.1 urease accessory protein UreF [Salipiger aestuarii]RAK12341.1 urease accessory protein [Salipiger aestuarii]
MTDLRSQLRMLQCCDSAFPSGAFAFSSGLETLVNEGRVKSATDLHQLLDGQVIPRWLDFDRPFLRQAFASAQDPDALYQIDTRCHLQNTVERLARASRRIGRSLLTVHARIATPGAKAYQDHLRANAPPEATGYEPIVQGMLGAGLGLDLSQAEVGALNTVVTGVTSAAVRLGKLGALDAQAVLAAAANAMVAGLSCPAPEYPGAFAPLVEIAAQRRTAEQISLFAN